MRPADRTDYIVGCIREAGSMYPEGARQFLAEHDAHRRAEVLAEAASVADAFTERWPNFNEMKADGIIGPFTPLGRLADELREMAGKDTSDARQAPAGESTQPAPARVWHVFDEDTAHATPRLYASEEAARLGTITRYEEMEGVCPDYSWRLDDDVWELLAGGEPVGIYFAPVPVTGEPEDDDAVYADVPDEPPTTPSVQASVDKLRALFAGGCMPAAEYTATRGEPGGDA